MYGPNGAPRAPGEGADAPESRAESRPRTRHPVKRPSGAGVRVVIADGDAPRRSTLRAGLHHEEVSVVGEAADASQVPYLAVRCRPDVVLMDVTLPPAGGVAAMRELADAAPGAKVVLLASTSEDEAGVVALAEGAAGYLSREIDHRSLADALERVVAGEAAISPGMALLVIERLRELFRGLTGMRPVKSRLTAREWEVLDLLAAGTSTAGIARELVVTTDTVHSHVRHILRKLHVHSRREAIEIAERQRRHRD
jgi:DNA-binding NarL/FixJ family response regulator